MKSTDPLQAKKEALENTINIGVSDHIYEACPINYKVFGKSGPSAAGPWSWLIVVRAADTGCGLL
jgi:hypothetical protein